MKLSTKRTVGALASGFVFGTGLVVSGMSDPKRVLAFLDLSGRWDPSLLLVMLAAVGVYFAAFRWSRRRRTAINGDPFMLPSRQRLDARLLVGAALFGVGWGISGFCPAPSIVALASGAPEVIVFVAASLAGSALVQRIEAAA
jgi:uncharacterized membrane protein YedE/YeeE